MGCALIHDFWKAARDAWSVDKAVIFDFVTPQEIVPLLTQLESDYCKIVEYKNAS